MSRILEEVQELSESQISDYQIGLWTGLCMFLMLLTAVCCVCNMEVVPDSLLYAKFQSQRANKGD